MNALKNALRHNPYKNFQTLLKPYKVACHNLAFIWLLPLNNLASTFK